MTQGAFSHWQKSIAVHEVKSEPPIEAVDLSPIFQFSQNSLQDYVDCARRFQLRYVLNQRWPAVESEPISDHERFIEEGSQFHLLVQRHVLGIPVEPMLPSEGDLRDWWQSFITSNPLKDLPAKFREPEVQLSAPLGDKRLLARFDLLCIDPGERIVIVDWKTSRFRPERQKLAQRLQSRVYPFVVTEAASYLFGGPIAPEQISLIYWFANEPTQLEVFTYDGAHHDDNRAYLSELIARITAHDAAIWPLTEDRDQCKYCVYRSLCDRGVKAASFEEVVSEVLEHSFEFDFDLDDVDEIAF